MGVYGYGGWSADAARCLGNKVTGYHSISSVTFFFSHSNGWSLQAYAVIIGGGSLIASAESALCSPPRGRDHHRGQLPGFFPLALATEPAYKGGESSLGCVFSLSTLCVHLLMLPICARPDLVLAIAETFPKYCYGSTPASQIVFSAQIHPSPQ